MRLGIREAVAVGVPYLVAVGACYLFGYWGTFNVNVLEFIGFGDIAKLAVYPLVVSLASFLAGMIVVGLWGSRTFPPGGGATSRVGAFGIRHWRWLVGLDVLLIVLVIGFGPEPIRWLIAASLVGFLSIPLTHLPQAIELLPDPRIRFAVLFVTLLLPAMGIATGRQQGYLVTQGLSKQYVDIARSGLPLVGDARHPVAYLGLLGGVYILREAKTGQLVFVKQTANTALFISSKPQ